MVDARGFPNLRGKNYVEDISYEEQAGDKAPK
jgi:hypothetical protein